MEAIVSPACTVYWNVPRTAVGSGVGVAVSSASGVGVASTASTTGSALLGVALAAVSAAAVGAAVASGVGRSRVQADITAAARSNERMSADLTRTKSPPELRM